MSELNKPPLNPEDVRRCGSTFDYDSGGTMPEVIQCDRYDGHEGSHGAPTRARFVWSSPEPSAPQGTDEAGESPEPIAYRCNRCGQAYSPDVDLKKHSGCADADCDGVLSVVVYPPSPPTKGEPR